MMMGSGSEPTLQYAGVLNNNSKGVDFSQYQGAITGLKVNWNRDGIVGLTLAINTQPKDSVVGTDLNGSEEEIYNLDSGDVIVAVFGRHSNHIDCFGILTKKGRSKVWGNPTTGNSFYFSNNNQFIPTLKVRASKGVEYIEPVFGDLLLWGLTKIPQSNSGLFSEELVVGGRGVEFNDFGFVKDKFNYWIKKIILKTHSQYGFLVGMEFQYSMDGKTVTAGDHTCSNYYGQFTVKDIALEENQEWVNLMIIKTLNKKISYVSLHTNKGRNLTVGVDQGVGYYFQCPEWHQIVAFAGDLDDGITSLRAYMVTVD